MITLELSLEDIERFKLFMKYYDVINTLLVNDVFMIKNGSATLHFSPTGHIVAIDLSRKLYKRTAIS